MFGGIKRIWQPGELFIPNKNNLQKVINTPFGLLPLRFYELYFKSKGLLSMLIIP